MKEYKKGDIIRIAPREGVTTWCRSHTYIHNGRGFVDTYWGDGTPYSFEELQKMASKVFDYDQNIVDMESLPYTLYENNAFLYAKKDYVFIDDKVLVRKGSSPVPERVIFQIHSEIGEKLGEVGSAVRDIEKRRALLKELQPNNPNYEDEGCENGEGI